ncbi:hypothetical protein [Jiulongibacter sp. NS-SX5]|uniref:hypothetical protein n=1 Tax=Jiulongibacter sp. NS-SX5 TaxID=3463854 RepID=UPI004059C651
MKKTGMFRMMAFTAMVSLLVLGGCKKDPIDEPIEYNFEEEFGEVELEEVEEVEPEATTSTEAETVESEAAEAALSGLANGEVTAELSTASSAISSTVEAEDIEATLAVMDENAVNELAAGGSLPAEAQSTIDAVLASGALDAFLSTVVDPTVDGEDVSARKRATDNPQKAEYLYGPTEVNLGIQDECTDAAQAAFDPAKATLDGLKTTQETAVTNTYNTRVTTINSEYDTDIAASTAKWQGKIQDRTALILSLIVNIDANTEMDATTKSLLKLIMFSKLADDIAKFNGQMAKQLSADAIKRDKKISKAGVARDTQLAAIQSVYDAELARITGIYQAAVNSCHNQGGSN